MEEIEQQKDSKIKLKRRPSGQLCHLVNYFGRTEKEILDYLEVDWDVVEIVAGVTNTYNCHLFFDINSQASIEIEETASAFITLISRQIEDLRKSEHITTKKILQLLCSSMIRLDVKSREGWIQDFCVAYNILPLTRSNNDVEVIIYYRKGRPVTVRCEDLFAIYVDSEMDLIHVGCEGYGTAILPSDEIFGLQANS